jgi:hypothetical protein
MAGWRALGETYAQIGDRFGVSRERVRQVLASLGLAGKLPRPEFCMVDGCGRKRSRSSRTYCRMHYERVRLHGEPGPAGSLKPRHPERCAGCGRPFGDEVRHSASGLCRPCYARKRYAAWTPEQRAQHNALVKRWKRRHPERAREIQRRATAAYQARQRAAREANP